MRQYEPFKRLFRLIGALLLMGAEVGAYGYVWNGYFNKMIEFPFWRRGNWLMIALYAGLLLFFLLTYGGFRIGYLKKRKSALFSDPFDRTFKSDYVYSDFSVR